MNKALQLLSLAMRAGKVSSGEFKTEESVKNGKSYLVIVAKDASDNTKKKFFNMCDFHKVPIADYSDKEEIGHYIGKEFRASVSIDDKGLAAGIISELKNQNVL